MRAIALVAVSLVTLSCSHQAQGPRPGGAVKAAARGEGAAPGSDTAPAGAPAPGSGGRAATVSIEYRKPLDPAHERLHAQLQERKVLEHVGEAIGVIRLPRDLTLSFAGCDGVSNAFYIEESAKILFCYEYVAEIEDAATKMMKAKPHPDAVDGPVVFVLFHEAAHAVFHLLGVPVLGKEEDAADFFAAYSLLRLGDEMALRMLRGAAWAYRRDLQPADLDVSDFSDVHSLDDQRYYNILCLAYGSDAQYFADAVVSEKLPRERAESCNAEYLQVRHAMQKLILPSIETERLDRVLMRHAAKKRR